MSSYRGSSGVGPWDGGPPGAEAEYAPAYPPPPQPATDPWTGAAYSQYAPAYDYSAQAYAQPAYNYSYDGYYRHTDGNYYKYPDSSAAPSSAYPPSVPTGGYGYPPPRAPERPRSPVDSRSYRRRSYSRSVSPYDRDRGYSRKRDSSYEGGRRGRSRSKSTKLKRHKYSSSSSSSRSRSYSRPRTIKKRRSSSGSVASDRSYKKSKRSRTSMTPPLKRRRSRSRSRRTPSPRSSSRSPLSKAMSKNKDFKIKIKKEIKKEVRTPSPVWETRKSVDRSPLTPPKTIKKERSVTPPPKNIKKESSITPPRSYKKERSVSPAKKFKSSSSKKHRESSLTPPKSYARRGSSSSKSRSRSSSPRKHKRSVSPRRSRSRSRCTSRSSSRSFSRRRSRSTSHRRKRRDSGSKHRSPSRSPSPGSKSRRPSKSTVKKRTGSPSRSKSKSPRPVSRSGTPPSDEELRRGQFTVADRKQFWRQHRSRIEEKNKEKTPPLEVKPPPADIIEKTQIDDIEYGDPPDVEGPNFADLLPSGKMFDPALVAAAAAAATSTSKTKAIPIPIKNDGSFLEMFKKMQEVTKKLEEAKKPEIKKPLPFIGKRRGGRVLKTGMVKKAKAIEEQNADTPKDAWSLYMQEVKKYREASCEEERKTRPLVK